MTTATEVSQSPPWQSRPPMLARFGWAAAMVLEKDSGQPVSLEAFEIGRIQRPHRAMKALAWVLLSPLWIPLMMVLGVVLAIPSMIYVPYRTWREWDEARSLGVGAASMIFTNVVMVGMAFWGGIMLALTLLGRLLPRTVVVARVADRTALLHQRVPMFFFPQFDRIEYCSHADLTQHSESTPNKILLSFRPSAGEPTKIQVMRGAKWAAGDPKVNAANLALLLR